MKNNDLSNAINDLLIDREDIHYKQAIQDISAIQDIQKKPAEWKKVLLRLTPNEYEFVSQKAWENRLDITKYLRKLIDDDMKREAKE